MANQIIPDHWVKSLILQVYFFLGLIILLFNNRELPLMGAEPLRLPIWIPFNLCDAPPEPLVLRDFIAVALALARRFCDILAPLDGLSLALQVLD